MKPASAASILRPMSEASVQRILMWSGAGLMLLFCLFPFAYMMAVSVSDSPEFLARGAAFGFTWAHYDGILTSPNLRFIDYLVNSLLISGLSALVCVAVATPAAYAIARLPLPGKVLILFFVLAVSMFPQISLVGWLFKLMTGLGWINTYQALVLPYVAWTLPLSLWILVSYFTQIPIDLDKAALVDGCSRLQVLTKVLLPVAAPGIFSTALLAFIFAFNEFLFALMLTSNHEARTVPVGIALFQGLHGQIPWGTIMAASALTTIPVVLLTLFFQRHITQGLTRGAVKG